MSLSTGDGVYIDCIGQYYGRKGTVIGRRPDGAYVVALEWQDSGPVCEIFAEEHLIPTLSNLPDGKAAGDALRRIMVGTAALPNMNDVMKKMGGFMEESIIKDSGERTEFETGAVRDMHEGKGDMLSLPWRALLRLSVHYENGAKKYGRFNYLKGIPVSSFIDSAFRHLAKYVAGFDDEDHLAAAAFNVLGALQMEEENPGMCDLEWRNGTKNYTYPKPVKADDIFPLGNETEEDTSNLFDGD